MPFYIGRKWADVARSGSDLRSSSMAPTSEGATPMANREPSVEDYGISIGAPIGREVSRNALIAWQRQEILRLQKENQRLHTEKERLFEMLEREQKIRGTTAPTTPSQEIAQEIVQEKPERRVAEVRRLRGV